MTPEPESGANIFPKDNPGPDNATLLRPVLDRLVNARRQVRGDYPEADTELRLALTHLREAINYYEAPR